MNDGPGFIEADSLDHDDRGERRHGGWPPDVGHPVLVGEVEWPGLDEKQSRPSAQNRANSLGKESQG